MAKIASRSGREFSCSWWIVTPFRWGLLIVGCVIAVIVFVIGLPTHGWPKK